MAEQNKKNVFEKIVDGWNNVITGLGLEGGKAKNPGAAFRRNLLSLRQLSDVYVSDGFGRKIIDKIAKDMTREWVHVNGDPANKILTKLNTLKAKSQFANLVRWSKLYGGAIILMGINDGGQFHEPVNEKRIRSVDFLHVLDRNYVFFQNENAYSDPTSPKYGEPEFYTVTASFDPQTVDQKSVIRRIFNIIATQNNQTQFVVHESRILRMDGVELPMIDRINNSGWGDSIFTAAFKQLSNLGQTYEYTAEYIHRMIQDVFKIKNLSSLMQRGTEGENVVKNRINSIQKCRSWFNAMMLDKEEDYQETVTQLQGLTDIIDKFILALCAAIDMPEVILMGRSPSGLNSSGDIDLTSWYDTIKSEQTDNLHPLLHRLISLIIQSSQMPSDVRKLATSEWDVVFNSLEQANRVEESTIRKTTAETDQIYQQIGVLNPEEIRQSRFGGGDYSTETEIQDIPDDDDDDLTDLLGAANNGNATGTTNASSTSN